MNITSNSIFLYSEGFRTCVIIFIKKKLPRKKLWFNSMYLDLSHSLKNVFNILIYVKDCGLH